MNKVKYYKTCLTIAGSDSSGGAGIQADLKTFSALGCYGMSVITALTAQNTSQVRSIHTPPAKFVGEQLEATLDDIKPDAVKIGMLANKEIIEVVAKILRRFNLKNIVIDPVMISKSGNALLLNDAITRLIEELLPLATILTPNIPEVSSLLKNKINLESKFIEDAAIEILNLGVESVLIKGGHNEKESCEDYYSSRKPFEDSAWISYPRINTKNTHGTGCTLASAITAYLAHGYSSKEAIIHARKFLQEAIIDGQHYKLGEGYGPPNIFWSTWK